MFELNSAHILNEPNFLPKSNSLEFWLSLQTQMNNLPINKSIYIYLFLFKKFNYGWIIL